MPVKGFDRLPKWAQKRMSALERKVESLQQELATMHAQERGRIWFGYDHPPHAVGGNLPDGVPVHFYVGPSDTNQTPPKFTVEAHDKVDLRDPHLRVSTGRGLFIKPVAANAVEIYPQRHFTLPHRATTP